MGRTDIRLLEKPFASYGTEKSFSAKAPVCVTVSNIFLNYGWLANAEKISGGISEKSNLWKRLLDSQLKVLFSALPVVQIEPSSSWGRTIPTSGKFRCQKHHDLAGKFRVWHVICSCIPISCRKLNFGLRMAQYVRSASLLFLGFWFRHQHCVALAPDP
jgi:hypothetical protein